MMSTNTLYKTFIFLIMIGLIFVSGCQTSVNEKTTGGSDSSIVSIEYGNALALVRKEVSGIKFEQYNLDNGLTVILHEDHSAPVVSVMVIYHVGSKDEKLGRTGFAHLYEHLMFEGSKNVVGNGHFHALQEAGAIVNGQTSSDWTRYFETGPTNFQERALFLEADRMGTLMQTMTQAKLDNQRDVVKNERRQRVDNVPYGRADELISNELYPKNHPYSWPVIGYMDDLSAASIDDVTSFFKTYYVPNNAVLVVAGDIEPNQTKEWVQKYFGQISRGKNIDRAVLVNFSLKNETRIVFEDNVQVSKLFIVWPSAVFNTPDDASLTVLANILGTGKSSRLYKKLVYEDQIAQDVLVIQNGNELSGEFGIIVTAKPGTNLSKIKSEVDAILSQVIHDGVTSFEMNKSLNSLYSSAIIGRESVLEKGSSLALYYTLTGDADNFNKEFERFGNITADRVQTAAKNYITPNRIILSVVPKGKPELAVNASQVIFEGLR